MNAMKTPKIKLPYGISNFKRLVLDGYHYVDKTKYIEEFEACNEPYMFFLRPRRFGKSLFVSQLRYYYGIEHKDHFDQIFANCYIGKNPTSKANTYHVLHLEFSRIDTSTEKSTYEGFLENVRNCIKAFIKQYGNLKSTEKTEILSETRPNIMLMKLFSSYSEAKIYVIIDEYDHFANEILAFNFNQFTTFVGKNGFVRKFYETIKTAAGDGIVDYFFGTGVTPITLDSMTSGFNIATNVSTQESFNDALGFTHQEVEQLIKLIIPDENHSEIVDDIKKLYNGYLFSRHANKRIYNPDMVLYYLNEFQKNSIPPDELVDTNIASDYGKIKKLFALQEPFRNSQVLDELMELNETTATLTPQYSFERDFDRDDFVSLLFYLGLISINRDHLDALIFSIPNYVIKALYRAFFIDFIKSENNLEFQIADVKSAIRDLAQKNQIHSFIQLIDNALKNLSNQDFKKFDEKYIKALFVGFASLSKLYFIKSEPEIDNKYPDILFLHRPPFFPKYQFLFELKYVSKAGEKSLKNQTNKAVTQVKEYLAFEEIRRLNNLKAYVLIVVGNEIKVIKEIA